MENFNVTLEYDSKNLGFPSYYFPYANQKGYLSPIVAMQVHNLPGIVMNRLSLNRLAITVY